MIAMILVQFAQTLNLVQSRKPQQNKNPLLARGELESMATEETDTIMAGHIKAMSKTVKKTTFESKRFKEDHAELYEEYAQHGYSTRFTVNYIK